MARNGAPTKIALLPYIRTKKLRLWQSRRSLKAEDKKWHTIDSLENQK
jgi:hypothetical protein